MSNLGQITVRLADYADFVRLNKEDSVMTKRLYVLKAFRTINNVTYSVSEAITEETLAQIADPDVIADAIIEKMKRKIGEKKP